MNASNTFIKEAVTQQMLLGKIARDLLEIDEKIEKIDFGHPSQPVRMFTKITNFLTKLISANKNQTA